MSSIRSDAQVPPVVIREGDVAVTLDAVFKVRSIKLGKGAVPGLEHAVTNAMNRASKHSRSNMHCGSNRAMADAKS